MCRRGTHAVWLQSPERRCGRDRQLSGQERGGRGAHPISREQKNTSPPHRKRAVFTAPPWAPARGAAVLPEEPGGRAQLAPLPAGAGCLRKTLCRPGTPGPRPGLRRERSWRRSVAERSPNPGRGELSLRRLLGLAVRGRGLPEGSPILEGRKRGGEVFIRTFFTSCLGSRVGFLRAVSGGV